MQIDYLSIIVVGIVTLFVGYFVGLFEGRGQEAPKEKKGEPPATPATALKENSLLNLSLDNNNLPRLELDGQRADSSQLAPEQRKRLIDLMVMMRPWIDASAPETINAITTGFDATDSNCAGSGFSCGDTANSQADIQVICVYACSKFEARRSGSHLHGRTD